MCFRSNIGLEMNLIFGMSGVLADSVQMKGSCVGRLKAIGIYSSPSQCLGMARVFQTGFRQMQKFIPCKIALFTTSLSQRKKGR